MILRARHLSTGALALAALLTSEGLAEAAPGRRRLSPAPEAPARTVAPEEDEDEGEDDEGDDDEDGGAGASEDEDDADDRDRADDADASEDAADEDDDGEGTTRFMFGFERLFGARFSMLELGDLEITQTRVTLLTAPDGMGFVPAARAGLDFNYEGSTFGVSLAYTLVPSNGDRLIHVGPRVGRLHRLGAGWDFWWRLGLGINHSQTEELAWLVLNWTTEGHFVYSPAAQVSLTFGFSLDEHAWSEVEDRFTGETLGIKHTELGLNFGMLAWF
jgi:hypothetical protein